MQPVKLNTFSFFFFLFPVISQMVPSRITLTNLSTNAGMKAASYGISGKNPNVRWRIVSRWHHARLAGPSDFFLKHPRHRPCLKTNTENYSWSFCLNLRLSEVQEHGGGCAWPWKWWWPRGRLRLADNKNGARMSRVSVLKWAKSSRNCSAACGKDSFSNWYDTVTPSLSEDWTFSEKFLDLKM